MARFSVEAVFKAIDRVTAPVGRMQARVQRMTRKLTAGFKRMGRVMSKISGGIMRGIKVGGIAAAGAITAVTLALNKVADSADELAKRSRRLQFPIEELQEWQFVAEQSGLSTDLFDNSLEKFAKRIGEARSGTGAMVTLLKKQNPELLKQITNTDNAAEALDVYLKAMRGTENQLDRTALATAAFGMKGAKFLNITEQSAEAVQRLRMEQRENGVVTAAQAAEAEKYNDAVNSLQKSLFGMMQQVLIPLMPLITKNIRAVREWMVANKELIQSKVAGWFEQIIDFLKTAAQNFETVVKWAKRIGVAIGIIFALTAALNVFIAVMTAVNIVMAMNPIGLIVLGIAALIAAVAAAIIWWDDLKAAFLDLPGPVKVALGILMGPITWIAGAASMIMDNWEPIKAFFADLWGGIVSTFESAMAGIRGVIDSIMAMYDKTIGTVSRGVNAVGDFLGFGGDEDDGTVSVNENQMGRGGATISPQERVSRSITESNSTDRSEVTIKDETGRAEVTKTGNRAPLKLQRSGGL